MASLRFSAPTTLLLCVLAAPTWARGADPQAAAQEPQAPQAVSSDQVNGAIDKLGDLDYPPRTAASRPLRRATPAAVVPALLQAVAGHPDGYVRYRALVLLTGFNDPRTKDVMRASLA